MLLCAWIVDPPLTAVADVDPELCELRAWALLLDALGKKRLPRRGFQSGERLSVHQTRDLALFFVF